MKAKHFLTVVLFLTLASAVTLAAKQAPAAAGNAATQIPQTKPQSQGERVFKQQCSRCHAAPDGFSPRISATIVRHMRVRAALSREDERELLHFLNP